MNALILIAEDESEIADILRAYLEREGFRTVHAANGRVALDLHLSLKPDLGLCCKHSGPPSGTAPLLGSGRFVEMLIEHGHGLGHGRGANAK